MLESAPLWASPVQTRTNPLPNVARRQVLRTNPKGSKTECVFADGTAILVSNFLASFIRAGDELLFPVELEAADAGTQIYIRNTNPEERRRDVFQAEIGYATQPRKDKRDNLFVAAEVCGPSLGISAIHLRCEALRDYFCVGDRRRAWDRQPSFYELLRVNPNVSPAELRLAFKLRSLELRTAHAPTGDLRALERAFNTLAQPELRACYDALRNDPASPVLFPCGGFGSLLVAGDLSRDGKTFYASRILSFRPEQNFKQLQAPVRKITFYKDHAIYRDSRHQTRGSLRPSIAAAVVGFGLESMETFARCQGRSQGALHSKRQVSTPSRRMASSEVGNCSFESPRSGAALKHC